MRAGAAAGLCSLVVLAGCQDGRFDFDLRGLSRGSFETSSALQTLPERPAPDARGVISYPTFQVVVAQRGETVRGIAQRLGLDAEALGAYNGINPDTQLRRDEIVALPGSGAGTGAGTASVPAAPIQPSGTAVTTTTLDPAPGGTPAPVTTPSPAPAAPVQTGTEPIRHRVASGETVYIIARRYNVPSDAIARWNGLDANLTIREGQTLLIPQPGDAPSTAALAPPPETTAPGVGSPTPVPPSAAAPLPAETPAPAAVAEQTPPPETAPDLGESQTPAADTSQLAMPVSGSIIRGYAPGRNEGIDIGAAAGSPVRAADAGTVAAVTTDTGGDNIVIIRHSSDLLTVYMRIDSLTVGQGDRVSRGQQIAEVAAGDPANLHFEVRLGMESADPTDYLP
ncbi:peptidoglycan DD-metalloendopeptidase family protein [Pseudoroseicyclus sp. CXY001]|uniref:peptidoglycan DD-metalloendopeptidase family protein n=1 Tax=Pseudoroseicyclus sp. CXY001 TaxID=3242492 RepID=UPI003570AADC